MPRTDPIVAWFIGDSITASVDLADPQMVGWGSFRHEAWRILSREPGQVDFVGQKEEVIPTYDAGKEHDGYKGKNARNIKNEIDGKIDALRLTPNVAVIEAGTVNLQGSSEYDPNAPVQPIQEIADEIEDLAVQTDVSRIVIVKVQPRDFGESTQEDRRVALNLLIDGVCDARGWSCIGDTWAHADLYDGTHPAPTGALLLGSAVAARISLLIRGEEIQ